MLCSCRYRGKKVGATAKADLSSLSFSRTLANLKRAQKRSCFSFLCPVHKKGRCTGPGSQKRAPRFCLRPYEHISPCALLLACFHEFLHLHALAPPEQQGSK